jgi:hypothetical protein
MVWPMWPAPSRAIFIMRVSEGGVSGMARTVGRRLVERKRGSDENAVCFVDSAVESDEMRQIGKTP